jgi:hypothetical protein
MDRNGRDGADRGRFCLLGSTNGLAPAKGGAGSMGGSLSSVHRSDLSRPVMRTQAWRWGVGLVLVAVAAWLGGFFLQSKDCCRTADELKVLQQEFGLNEAQTARIRMRCKKRCVCVTNARGRCWSRWYGSVRKFPPPNGIGFCRPCNGAWFVRG